MKRNRIEVAGVPRYFLSAPAEITAEITVPTAAAFARCAELSSHGCYFETNLVISRGTLVHVRIFAAESTECFEAKARVVYLHPPELCVVFQSVSRECNQILDKWIAAARLEQVNTETRL